VVTKSRKTQRPKPDQAEVTPSPFGQHDTTGVDLSLLRWMLRLSPLERLAKMEQHTRETQTLLEHGRRHREAKAARPR
jgi:hypothetical protein